MNPHITFNINLPQDAAASSATKAQFSSDQSLPTPHSGSAADTASTSLPTPMDTGATGSVGASQAPPGSMAVQGADSGLPTPMDVGGRGAAGAVDEAPTPMNAMKATGSQMRSGDVPTPFDAQDTASAVGAADLPEPEMLEQDGTNENDEPKSDESGRSGDKASKASKSTKKASKKQ